MAVKKLISSPSASSSSSDSSFERSEAQRTQSLKRKQCDSEGEEKESEDSFVDENDNDSSSANSTSGDAGKTKSVEGMANSTSGDAVRERARCLIYLRELISRQKLPTWLSTVEDVVHRLGELRARDLEAKAKQLSIDAMKLHAREKKFMADLLDVVADEMAGDG